MSLEPGELIGTYHADRIRCTTDRHLLRCCNPLDQVTCCQCGEHRLDGHHTTWHERDLWATRPRPGHPGEISGYDRYTLTMCECHPTGMVGVEQGALPGVVA